VHVSTLPCMQIVVWIFSVFFLSCVLTRIKSHTSMTLYCSLLLLTLYLWLRLDPLQQFCANR
jgi:hypothetical protein